MVRQCLRDDMFSCFDGTLARDRQTDRQTHGHSIYRASIASRGKNKAHFKSNETTGKSQHL